MSVFFYGKFECRLYHPSNLCSTFQLRITKFDNDRDYQELLRQREYSLLVRNI